MKTLFDLPGGATLAPAFVAIYEEALFHGLRPDIMTTVSVNSLLAFHLAMGVVNENFIEIAKQTSLKIDSKQIWKKNPFKSNGKLSIKAILRMITQKPSFGIQDTRNLFKNHVSIEMFEEYKKGVENGVFCEIFISTWDWRTKKNIFFRAYDLKYNDLIEVVEASAHIDTITNPVWVKGWGWQYDSGRIDQNSGHKFLNGDHLNFNDTLSFRQNIQKVFSIYPRKEFIETRPPKSWFIVNDSNTKAIIIENSKGDEAQMKVFCYENNIKHKKVIFNSPNIPIYETDRQIMNYLYSIGKKQARHQLNKDCNHLD